MTFSVGPSGNWLLGLLLGARHALDPDHLAAVSTLVARERNSRGAAFLGACWGAGHAFTLVVVAGTLLALRATMPTRTADLCELVVAAMLIVLGARALRTAFRAGRSGAPTIHSHGAAPAHRHAGQADHVHVGAWVLSRRPLFVGVVHGLAGSGALTTLVIAGSPTIADGLLQIVLFALGSLVGMAVLTGLAGWPVARLAESPRFHALLVGATGAFSLGLGAWWGWPLTLRFIAP